MAKLLILRGDVRHAEFELPAATVRVGRSPHNEIVLEDSGKGVSRTHAEIRFEGGRHLLVDNSSQNGIWVEGARVPSVVLEPGVVASVGPYRLMVEPDDTTVDASSATAATEITGRLARQTQMGVEEEPSQPEGPVTAREPTNQQPAVGAAVAKKVSEHRDVKGIVVTAIAVVLLVSAGVAVYSLMQPQDNIANPADEWFAPASAMVNEGRCPEAIAQYLDPALARNPNDARAVDLKKTCTDRPSVSVPLPPTPPRPLTPTELLLDKAEGMMTAGGGSPDGTACQAVMATAKQVLDQEPGNQHAIELTSRSGVCLQRHQLAAAEAKRKQSAPTVSTTAARETELSQTYEQGKAFLAEGDYDGAERVFNGLPGDYRDVGELRKTAELAKKKRQANNALADAQAAESRGDLLYAEDQYKRAKDLDPGISIEAKLKDLKERRHKRAQDKCYEAEALALRGAAAQASNLFGEASKLVRSGETCCGGCSIKVP